MWEGNDLLQQREVNMKDPCLAFPVISEIFTKSMISTYKIFSENWLNIASMTRD